MGGLEKAEHYLTVAADLFPVYAPHDTKALAHNKAILTAIQERIERKCKRRATRESR
jgi:hypothetical protein